MQPSTRTWWATPWPGALLALLAWGLVTPGEAKAGCRHPGVSASGSASLFDQLDRLMAGDPAPIPKRVPTGGPVPCKGPSCSGQEAPAPSSPTTTVSDPGPRWALVAIVSPNATANSQAIPLDEARPRPAHILLSIFHPPRLAGSPPNS